MKAPVVVIGLGEMGRLVAAGLLRAGHPVYPITREMDLDRESTLVPGPEMAVVAVGEKDLHSVLEGMPENWRDRSCLLQNELLPQDWREHRILRPTVIVAWFEKKRGRGITVILPSPVYGPKASLLLSALGSLEIPAVEVRDAADMLREMVRKNLYILCANLAGLVVGGTVGDLWSRHRPLAREIANEVLDVQQWLVREALPREQLIAALGEAFEADPDHEALGRSARERLLRVLRTADEAGLAVARVRQIRQEIG